MPSDNHRQVRTIQHASLWLQWDVSRECLWAVCPSFCPDLWACHSLTRNRGDPPRSQNFSQSEPQVIFGLMALNEHEQQAVDWITEYQVLLENLASLPSHSGHASNYLPLCVVLSVKLDVAGQRA